MGYARSQRAFGVTFSVIAASAAIAVPAMADVRVYTKIADLGTPVPGGTGNFTSFPSAQVSQGNIVFGGLGGASQRGLYRFNPIASSLSTIVNEATVLPTGPSALTYNLSPTLSFAVFGPDVSFVANAGIPSSEIVTTQGAGGGLRSMVDGLAAPINPISMDAQHVMHAAAVPPGPGTGFAVRNFDGSTASTFGGGPFTSINRFIARAGGAAFHSNRVLTGTRGGYSLYTPSFHFDFSDGGGIPAMQPSSFLLPGQATGTVFSAPGISGAPLFSVDDARNVAFRATAVDGSFNPVFTGIYARPFGSTGSTLQVVADTNTIVPTFDGTSKFAVFDSVAIDGLTVAFIGGPGANARGIYAASGGGALSEIISPGDVLDGKTIQTLKFSDDRALSGDQLVFTANFTDGSTGLFLAQVPEPGALFGLVAGAWTLGSRRRRLRGCQKAV